jgi:hypothetical protein
VISKYFIKCKELSWIGSRVLVAFILIQGVFLEFNAQEFHYHKISAQKGLYSSTIYNMYVAPSGMIYLSFETGLARFNGINFRTIPMKGERSKAVNAIQQDQYGTIWCKNFTNQVFFLDGDTLKAHEKINQTIDLSSPLRYIAVHSNGLYILTEKNLFLFTRNGDIAKLLSIDEGTVSNTFIEIITNPANNNIFIVDGYSIMELNHKHEIVRKTKTISGQTTLCIHNDKLVVGGNSGTQRISFGEETIYISDEIGKTYINKIVSTGSSLWLCTNSGLIKYDQANKTFSQLYFSKTRITDIVQDFQGGYWVSSVDRGLFYIPNIETRAIRISDYNIYRISVGPDNTFFFGTGNGEIFQFDFHGKFINQFKTNFISEVEFIYFDDKFNRLITSHGVFELPSGRGVLPTRLGKNIIRDNKNNFLLNTYNKAVLINEDFSTPPKISSIAYKNEDLIAYGEQEVPVFQLYKNRSASGIFDSVKNVFYIGAYDAIQKIDYRGNREVIKYDGENVLATHMSRAYDGTILVSTRQRGVLRLEDDNYSPYFSEDDFDLGGHCFKTYDTKDRLYILNEMGLMMFDKSRNKLTNLSSSLSLKNINIFDFTLIDDKICLATDDGVLFLPVPVYLTKVFPRLNRITLLDGEGNEIVSNNNIDYRNNNLRVDIDAIHFKNFGEFEYHYRLVGFDDKWSTQLSTFSTFNLGSLAPGTYRFEVKILLNGEFSEISSIDFIIRTPFYLATWFYLIISVFLILMVYMIFK